MLRETLTLQSGRWVANGVLLVHGGNPPQACAVDADAGRSNGAADAALPDARRLPPAPTYDADGAWVPPGERLLSTEWSSQ